MSNINSKYNMKQAGEKGFTLLESLIVIFIFSLVIITANSVFVGIFGNQKAAKNMQRNIEETRTALDLMTKTIRMSSKTTTGVAGGSSVIYLYNNSQGKCISYKFESDALKASEVSGNPEDCDNTGIYSYVPITSVQIKNGKFFVTETDASNGIIGKAVVTMEVSDTKLETAVSFRDYKGSVQ